MAELSDDLVKHLRDRRIIMTMPDGKRKFVKHVAADRIEQLEAALREIIVHCEVPAPPNAEALKMFARKALEGKDD
jgi:hypothetical protein